jgi:hypothetical protein
MGFFGERKRNELEIWDGICVVRDEEVRYKI